MKLDFKNILIGIIIGVLSTIIIGCLLSDVYIDIQIGDIDKINTKLEKQISFFEDEKVGIVYGRIYGKEWVSMVRWRCRGS